MNTTEVTMIKLENNKEYILLDEFTYNNEQYVVLVNTLDKTDFVIRQVLNDELIGLKDEAHFQKVFMAYSEYKTVR